MPEINWTLDVGDLIIAVVGLVLVPTARVTIAALSSIRRAVEDLTITVYGTTKDPSVGILAQVGELRRHGQKAHQRLAEVELELGIRRDRS